METYIKSSNIDNTGKSDYSYFPTNVKPMKKTKSALAEAPADVGYLPKNLSYTPILWKLVCL